MPKFKYDYYTVYVPGDMYIPENVNVDADGLTAAEASAAVSVEIMRLLKLLAISEAKQRTKVRAMSDDWSARHVRGGIGDRLVIFQVCRKRNT